MAEGRHGRRAEVDAYGLTRWRVVDAAVAWCAPDTTPTGFSVVVLHKDTRRMAWALWFAVTRARVGA